MREIKFRAWNPETGMLKFELHAAHGIRLISSDPLENHKASDDEYVFMEFTGMKDTSRTEIFEGDILQDEEGDIFEIIYREDEGCFKGDLVGEDGKKIYQELGMGDLFGIVIGNVYENPELLK